MAKKTSRMNGLYFHDHVYSSFAAPAWDAAEYGCVSTVCDVKALLEALAGTGKEVVVEEAKLRVQLTIGDNTTINFHRVAFVVSDAAITDYDLATQSTNVADAIDGLTAGDMEYIVYPQIFRGRQTAANLQVVDINLDVTAEIRKAARLLARSAVLSTNPYINLVLITYGTLASKSFSGAGSLLSIRYYPQNRTSRMLG